MILIAWYMVHNHMLLRAHLLICWPVLVRLTFRSMDTHTVDQQQVLMGDLAHHAGGLKEGLAGEKKDHEGTQANKMEIVAIIMDIIYIHFNIYIKVYIYYVHNYSNNLHYSIIHTFLEPSLYRVAAHSECRIQESQNINLMFTTLPSR